MRENDLSLSTLAVLVGSVSDNDAANTLLDHLGLDRVQENSTLLGIPHTRLDDRIRLERTTAHPPSPSQARTADLATFMDLTATGRLVNAAVSTLVAEWLATGTDLSMVAPHWARTGAQRCTLEALLTHRGVGPCVLKPLLED